MKFIKEYRLFENTGVQFNYSDDNFINSLNFKIEDIFSPRGEDGYVVRVNSVQSRLDASNVISNIEIYQVSRHNKRDIVFFRAEDISKNLEELVEIDPIDFVFTAAFVDRRGGLILRAFSDLNTLINENGHLEHLKIRLVVNRNSNISNKCSNPECDNTLDKDEEKCPVCGENQ